MMKVINKIRNEPKSIIEDLNLLLNKNNQENGKKMQDQVNVMKIQELFKNSAEMF